MIFWDASAVVPLCLDEPWTPLLTQVLAEDPLMLVWWGSMVECWSAFARLRRGGLFDTRDEEHALFLPALPPPGRRSSPVRPCGTTLRAPCSGTLCARRMGCNWPRRSCGSTVSRSGSPLPAWIIDYGLLPNVKAFCSSHLRHLSKYPRPLSIPEGKALS